MSSTVFTSHCRKYNQGYNLEEESSYTTKARPLVITTQSSKKLNYNQTNRQVSTPVSERAATTLS